MSSLAVVAACVLAGCAVVAWILWSVKKDIEDLSEAISNTVRCLDLYGADVCCETAETDGEEKPA